LKYIYTKGKWREYFGYIFFDGKPTDVTDKATLERIKREVDFQPYEESEDGEEAQASDTPTVLKGKECSKCHKIIPRGWYMHQRYCRNPS
jgi:hypothetical protein